MVVFRRRGAHFRPRAPRPAVSAVLVLENGTLVPCRCARRFFDRLRGLLGASSQAYAKEALLLSDCSSIHTNGMEYPIDVMFIDANPCDPDVCTVLADGRLAGDARVLASYSSVPAGKVLSCPGARAVVERPSSDAVWPRAGDMLIYLYREGGIGDVEGLQPLVRT